ncbi:MAG TPA: hypothetical protein VEC19_10645 [Usitatibacter sp.]|nr:hypothetical protein [Usitatibacter sp.]
MASISGGLRGAVLLGVAALAGALVLSPLPTLSIPPVGGINDVNVDVDFQLGMPALFRDGVPFGPQAIFTYGPLGWLAGPWLPADLAPIAIAANALVAALFAVFIARLALQMGRLAPAGWIAVAMLAIAVFLGWTSALYAAIPLGAFVCAVSREDSGMAGRVLAALLLAAAAVVSLVKFNYFMLAGLGIVLLAACDLARRRVPWWAIAYAVLVAGAWKAAGQDLANLPQWIASSLNLAMGYPDAMARDYDTYSVPATIAFYAACGLPVLLALLRIAPQARRLPCDVASLAMAAAFMYVMVKHAFGGNQLEQAAVGVVLGALLCAWLVARRGSAWAAACCVACAALALGVAYAYNLFFQVPSLPAALARAKAQAEAVALAARGDFAPFGAARQRFLDRVAAVTRPVSTLSGTADAYPHGASIVLSQPGLRYQPRPAYLSLNAHTEHLALRNAAHLRSAAAADVLLFRLLPPEAAVNRRLPMTEDGASWPEIVSRYRPTDVQAPYLVLARRDRPLGYRLRPLGQAVAARGQAIAVPRADHGLVWMQVDVRRSAYGHAIHSAFKSPHVLLELAREAGPAGTWQIVPGLGRAGFLVSPVVATTAEFAQLARERRAPASLPRVTTLRWTSPQAPAGFWEDAAVVRFYALEFDS